MMIVVVVVVVAVLLVRTRPLPTAHRATAAMRCLEYIRGRVPSKHDVYSKILLRVFNNHVLPPLAAS